MLKYVIVFLTFGGNGDMDIDVVDTGMTSMSQCQTVAREMVSSDGWEHSRKPVKRMFKMDRVYWKCVGVKE